MNAGHGGKAAGSRAEAPTHGGALCGVARGAPIGANPARRGTGATAVLAALAALGLGGAVAPPAGTQARTWYVTVEGNGDAPTIQAAVDSAATGDSIVVAPGYYSWSNQGSGDEMGFIRLMRGKDYITLRSEAGPAATTLDAEYRSRVIYCQGMNHATIEGFTIKRGEAPAWGDYCGGGFFTHIPRDAVRNCVFLYNRAQYGGGVSCVINDGTFVLENCTFIGNEATRSGGAVILANGMGLPSIIGCVMRGNRATLDGGAVYQYNCPSLIDRCVVAGNEAGRDGGAFHGAAVADARIARSTICRNDSPNYAVGASGGAGFSLELVVVAFNAGAGLALGGTAAASIACCDVFGNAGGDAIPPGFADGGGTIALDPLFCGVPGSDNYYLRSDSPCLPFVNPDPAALRPGTACSTMGAFPAGCGTTAIERSSWGRIKGVYR